VGAQFPSALARTAVSEVRDGRPDAQLAVIGSKMSLVVWSIASSFRFSFSYT